MSTCTHLTVVDQVIGHIEAVRDLISHHIGEPEAWRTTRNLAGLVDRVYRGAGDGALIAAITGFLDQASDMAYRLPDDALEGVRR